MNKRMIIWIVFLVLVSQIAMADYFYTPMNFDSPTNHSFDISLNGSINVVIPDNFTYISGDLSGNDNISFVIQSPLIDTTTPQLFVGEIYLDGELYDNFYLLSVDDSKIVDTKVEVGHGDFNYIDPTGYIGTDNTLLFDIVRVWAMGSDIIGEPARDITFNCTYPLIIPNTVDSKIDTTYNSNNITGTGTLSRMEGISMFRVFVLSQEADYEEGEHYEVSCDSLSYSFPHTEVIADIQDIDLEARSLEPLSISMSNNEGYITYTFINDEEYDIRDIELLWTIGTHTSRQELDELKSGEFIQYNIAVNESGSVDFEVNFIPEWMFNSRSPTYYTQTQFDTYYAPSFLDSLDYNDYYSNQTVLKTPILETQIMKFGIDILQDAPFGGAYKIEYEFYDEEGVLIDTVARQIVGTGEHIISFSDPELDPSGLQENYKVYTTISFLDEEGDWWSFDTSYIGIQNVASLTDNGIKEVGPYDVIVSTESARYEDNDVITGTITLINTGDAPDEDTVLTYYLIGPDGEKYGETKEQILEVPIGTTYYEREITLPSGANPGEWEFHVDYQTVVQPEIEVYDSFEVVDNLTVSEEVGRMSVTQWVWYIIWLGILIMFLLIGYLLVFGRKRKQQNANL